MPNQHGREELAAPRRPRCRSRTEAFVAAAPPDAPRKITKSAPSSPRSSPAFSEALAKAVAAYDFEEALWHVDSGLADPDQVCAGGETLLTKACGAGDVEVARALLQHGCAVDHRNAGGRTALMKAAAGGHLAALKLLVGPGAADLFVQDVSGKTALDWARLSRRKECARHLERAIGDVIAARRKAKRDAARLRALADGVLADNVALAETLRTHVRDNDLVAIHELVRSVGLSRAAFERAKAEHAALGGDAESGGAGYYIDATIEGGVTALIRAAAENNLELIVLLLDSGASIDFAPMSSGHNALTWACTCGQFEAVQTLLAHGAAVAFRTRKEGKTPLMHAISADQGRIAMYLVDHTLNSAMSAQGALARSAGVTETDVDAVGGLRDWSRYFQEAIHVRDARGRTAADYARRAGNEDILLVLEEAQERLDERDKRVQQERECTKLAQCVNKCGFSDRADRIERHEQWHCPRRMLQCQRVCGARVPASSMDDHLEHECTFRIVRCCNVYRGCSTKMRQADIESHELHKCNYRTTSCRLGCGAEVLFKDLGDHEMQACPKRVVQCKPVHRSGGCGAHMEWTALAHHLQHACPRREVKCRVGCGDWFPFAERNAHEEQECKRPCAMGCGLVLGPRTRREVHEQHLCGHRVVACRLECGIEGLKEMNRHQHETEECVRRPQPCPLRCGETLEHQHVADHITGEAGSCANRLLPCLLDYVGRRVRLTPFGDGAAPYVAFVESFDSQEGTHRVRTADAAREVRDVRLGSDVARCEPLDFEAWACGLMRAKDREEHLHAVCQKRKLACPNKCGQVLQAEQLEPHLQQGCVRRRTVCANTGCGAELEWHAKWEHEHHECKFQQVRCSCGEWLDRQRLASHAVAECQAAKVRCLLGCGKYVERRAMDEHVTNQCGKRDVVCSNGCGAVMWAEELPDHLSTVCPLRLLPCDQCGSRQAATAQDFEDHKHNTCPERTITCECGERMRLPLHSEHLENTCPRRLRWCSLGCGNRVPDEEMEHHEARHCPKRVELCRVGCGREIRVDLREAHEADECTKRAIACPNGCGDTLRVEFRDEHLAVCPDRVVPCGAGSAACKRKVRSWLTGGVFTGSGRLVRCAAHGETVLSWAASQGEAALAESVMSQIQTPPPPPEPAVRSVRSKADLRKRRDPAEMERLQRNRVRDILSQESSIGQTPVTLAASKGHLAILQRFRELGADLNYETSRGRTPLVEALLTAQTDVVKFLLRERVLVDRKTKTGILPLDLVDRLGNHGLAEMMRTTLKLAEDQMTLFRSITLSDMDALERLLGIGEPYFLNQECALEIECDELRRDIESLLGEEKDLCAAEETAKPLLLKKQAARDAVEARVAALREKIKVNEDEQVELATTKLDPSVRASSLALQFLRDNDLRELAQVQEASPRMELIMKAVCTLLDVGPNKRPHALRPMETLDDYWTAGCARIVRRPAREVKRELLNMLKLGLVPAERTEACRLIFAEIDALDSAAACAGAGAGAGAGAPVDVHEMMEAFMESTRAHDDGASSDGGGSEGSQQGDERDVFHGLKALFFWAHAIEAHDRVQRRAIDTLKVQVGKMRVELNAAELELDAATDSLRFAENSVLSATEPLAEVRKEIQERRRDLVDCKEQLYCVRLVSTRTLGGHTALSWAAMYGNPRVVDFLLEHGASVDYEDEQRILAATLIQLMVRNRLARLRRPPWTPALSLQFQREDLVFYFRLKTTARKHRAFRYSSRAPLALAVFNGHKEAAQVLLNWGANIHRISPVFPVGPAPFLFPTPWPHVNRGFRLGQAPVFATAQKKQPAASGDGDGGDDDDSGAGERVLDAEDDEIKHEEETELQRDQRESLEPVLSVLACAEEGVRRQGCKAFQFGKGWVEQGPNAATLKWVRKMWYLAQERRQYLLEAERLRLARVREADKTRKLHERMRSAILREEFHTIEALCKLGASIDYEIPEGYTALGYAAMRGTESLNRDGALVLAVEVLLDLEHKVPNVNREMRAMHTALSLASRSGRVNVMEALLNRKADVNRVLRDGKTALIHAAAAGKWDACRLLLERGADLEHADMHGCTAIDVARTSHFVDVVRKLSERRAGVLGDATVLPGDANPLVTCAWGCGAKLRRLPASFFSRSKTRKEIDEEEDPEHAAFHEANLCPKRVVECPFGCGVQELWHEELAHHRDALCPRRPVACTLGCGEQVHAEALEAHVSGQCCRRRVVCLRCDARVILDKMALHDRSECPARAQVCDSECGAVVPWNQYARHRQRECPNRQVTCLDCGKAMTAAKRVTHQELHCAMRIVPCKWGCFDGARYVDKVKHELNECPRRPVPCPQRCKADVEAQRMEQHLRKDCVRRFVPCVLGCFMKVPEADMELHTHKECKKRLVRCPNVGCELAEGELTLRAEDLSEHAAECSHRPVACGTGCGERVALARLEEHKLLACSKRTVQCRTGCPKRMPMDELAAHERDQCRKRIVWCGQGCDATMPADKRNRHQKRECPKRVVLCGLGCGEEMREEDRAAHEANACIRRGEQRLQL